MVATACSWSSLSIEYTSSSSTTTSATSTSYEGWYRVTRESGSDCTVYDVYGPNGQHYEEYVYDSFCDSGAEPPEEAPLPAPQKKKRAPKVLASAVRSRVPVITTPPGGWFFFKG